MTKAAALYQFWSSFGLKAYEANSVPSGEDAPSFPYLTYSVVTDSIESSVALTANLWYRSSSWTDCNAKAEEISKYIGRGGHVMAYDGGAVWLRRGTPFAQSMGDSTDDLIKRKYINITAEFLSAD